MSTRPNPTKRALVISGGGSKGAFAGGIARYLIEEKHRDYQIFAGTSAGSLLIPLLALGEVERIKAVFTTIEQHHIFSICPFRIRRGADGLLTEHSFIFDTGQMSRWWAEGFTHAMDNGPVCREFK